MNKLRSVLILLLVPFFTGCDSEVWETFLRQAQNAPAQVALDTISKLVTAESVFRGGNNRYAYDAEVLNTLFVRNEYEILVEDHEFFYCYDSAEKEMLGELIAGNFIVLAVDPYGNVLGKGSSIFTERLPLLNDLPAFQKKSLGFSTVLEISEGDCFQILPHFGRETSVEEHQLSLEEVQNLMKELHNLSEQEREALHRKVNDFIDLLQPTQKVPRWQKSQPITPPVFRLRLRKAPPSPKPQTAQ